MFTPQPRTAIVFPPEFKHSQWASESIPIASPETTVKPAFVSSEEIQIAEKALVGIESDVSLIEFSAKDVKNIFEDPGFALSKIPVTPQPFSLIGSGVIIERAAKLTLFPVKLYLNLPFFP